MSSITLSLLNITDKVYIHRTPRGLFPPSATSLELGECLQNTGEDFLIVNLCNARLTFRYFLHPIVELSERCLTHTTLPKRLNVNPISL